MRTYTLVVMTIIASALSLCSASPMPEGSEYINSIGIKLVRIERGTFRMGQLKTLPPDVLPEYRGRGLFDNLSEGDFDEKPVHPVQITRPYYIGAFEVTNLQYELFDPAHKTFRGKRGLSKEDDEAVTYVTWYDAQAFCRWLSHQEGLTYRLPTEAEWEYACRAGTDTNYYAKDVLPAEFLSRTKPALKVGRTPPNAWGLYDMHGNVEEWCHDWYGPYMPEHQSDPLGYAQGDFRVVRGGSHGADVYYARSANRMGALPNDRMWLLGFRVVLADLPKTQTLPVPQPPLNQQNVTERDPDLVGKGPDPGKPYFKGPRKYVKIPTAANGPLFGCHNHDPAIVECPNGDLLAVWYTCASESGRELAQAAARLIWRRDTWQQASAFWDIPDRNDHAPALWFDARGTIFHFSAMSFGPRHHEAALIMRTSRDSGATWSAARIISPEYNACHKPSEPVFRLHDGGIVLVSDWPNVDGYNASGLWVSRDQGLTWTAMPGVIRGIHAGLAQLDNGCLLGYGRPEAWNLPKSISCDLGRSFTYEQSEFPSVGGAQRNVLLRLREGPLFLAGFADRGIDIVDSAGNKRRVRGLYAAVSQDQGKTWPHKRLVTHDGLPTAVECTDGGLFIMSSRNAEYQGYLSVCQGLDGLVHLISSRQHYAFNLEWLKTASPPVAAPPVPVKPVVETFTGPTAFDDEGWVHYHSCLGRFNGKGQYTINSRTHHNGINRNVGSGSFEISLAVKNIHYNPVSDRVSEGLSIWLKDDRARHCAVSFKEDHIKLEIRDIETSLPLPGAGYREGMGWRWEDTQARYPEPPESLKAKFTWDEKSRRLRIYYGLNGAGPTTELAQSIQGIYFGRPLTESTAFYILMSNGQIDVDHYEIRPAND